MNTRTRIAMQQAALRSRPKRSQGARSAIKLNNELQRRIAATTLAYTRGYSPADIAHLFKWPVADVERWIEAGRPLL